MKVYFCKHCSKSSLSYPSVKRIYCSVKCRSINQIGNKNHFWGKKHSLKTRKIISMLQKGKKLSPKHKKKISKSLKGKYLREKSSRWKGGRRIDSHNYILIHEPTHPFCGRDGYVFEHRLIAETILKRLLTRRETIHHIDSNPQNNIASNLYLFPSQSKHLSYHRLSHNNPQKKITKSNLY